MARKHTMESCELCLQKRNLSFHHLIPRKLHRRKGFRKKYDQEMLDKGLYLCNLCHKGLHKLYDELTLANNFGNKEAIVADQAMAKHIAWSVKQKVSVAEDRNIGFDDE